MEGIKIQFAPFDLVKAGSFLHQLGMISLSKFGILILGVVFILCKQNLFNWEKKYVTYDESEKKKKYYCVLLMYLNLYVLMLTGFLRRE